MKAKPQSTPGSSVPGPSLRSSPSRRGARLLGVALALVAGASAWAALLRPAPRVDASVGTGDRAAVAGRPSPERLDLAETARAQLAALGYVGSAGPDTVGLPTGVLTQPHESHAPRLTFTSNVEGCSAQLVDDRGRALHHWRLQPCFRWDGVELLHDGGVIAVHRDSLPQGTSEADPRGRALVRLDAAGREVWRVNAAVHHGLDASHPERPTLALAYALRDEPSIHALPVRDDVILEVSAEGRILDRHSVFDLLRRAAPGVAPLNEAPTDLHESSEDFDLLHTNAVAWLPGPRAQRRVVLTVRNQNLVAIADLDEGRIVWAWGRDVLQSPHDATPLANGNLLVFDNRPGAASSRVVEIDPGTDRVVWSFEGQSDSEFHSVRRGAAQRLPDGNTLITSSNEGRLLEVSPAGELVWSYRNPELSGNDEPLAFFRARRVQASWLKHPR